MNQLREKVKSFIQTLRDKSLVDFMRASDREMVIDEITNFIKENKPKKSKGTYVSRSEYQRVCEENKRLIADLKIISTGKPMDSIAVEMKWAAQFEKEKKFNETITSVVQEYVKAFPDSINTKIPKKK